jgi:hypothetical protein
MAPLAQKTIEIEAPAPVLQLKSKLRHLSFEIEAPAPVFHGFVAVEPVGARVREVSVFKSRRLEFAASSNASIRNPCSRWPRCKAAPNRPAVTSAPGDIMRLLTACVTPSTATPSRLRRWAMLRSVCRMREFKVMRSVA